MRVLCVCVLCVCARGGLTLRLPAACLWAQSLGESSQSASTANAGSTTQKRGPFSPAVVDKEAGNPKVATVNADYASQVCVRACVRMCPRP